MTIVFKMDFFYEYQWIKSSKIVPWKYCNQIRTKLIKVHTVKSQLIAQFDRSNGQTSVAISWGCSLTKESTILTDQVVQPVRPTPKGPDSFILIY